MHVRGCVRRERETASGKKQGTCCESASRSCCPEDTSELLSNSIAGRLDDEAIGLRTPPPIGLVVGFTSRANIANDRALTAARLVWRPLFPPDPAATLSLRTAATRQNTGAMSDDGADANGDFEDGCAVALPAPTSRCSEHTG